MLGNNGVLKQASNAVIENRKATALEKIQVEVAGSYGLDGKIDKEQLNTNLSKISGLTYNQQAINLNDSSTKISTLPATVKLDGYAYTISEDGSVDKVVWTYNNGSYTNAETGQIIRIGDKINYDEGTGYTYTTERSKGIGGSLGNSGNPDSNQRYVLESKTYTTENLTWRVLGINESGKIELLSENPMSDSNKVYLANEESYLYGPEQLNKMCNDLYSNGNGANSARSLNVEDIDKLANIKTDIDKKILIESYGNKWKYRFPSTTEKTGNRFLYL